MYGKASNCEPNANMQNRQAQKFQEIEINKSV